jgi:YVTN family beta-propeller protein
MVSVMRRYLPSLGIAALLLSACSATSGDDQQVKAAGARPAAPTPSVAGSAAKPRTTTAAAGRMRLLPHMPPLLDPHDIYAADRPGRLSPVVRQDPALVYVPNSESGTLDVIDQRTFRIVGHYQVGQLPQHVTPSYDMRRLYVLNDRSNSLTVVNPRTGKPGRTIPVTDPYNMYFTPDGRYAIVVAEALQRLDFRDARTMRLVRSVPVDCLGIDHADFTADGRYAIFSCEFSGKLLKLDVAHQRVMGTIHVREGGSPQDVKTSPDGKVMYVADQYANGVQIIDPRRFKEIGFLHTGTGAHGLYVNRQSTWLYVTNRRDSSISVIDLRTRTVVHTWHIPGGGSPDMGGLSADGKVLWLSGRYSSVVYALNARTGRLLAKIPVGSSPHGLCVYPQPGRYSLGHTGVFR